MKTKRQITEEVIAAVKEHGQKVLETRKKLTEELYLINSEYKALSDEFDSLLTKAVRASEEEYDIILKRKDVLIKRLAEIDESVFSKAEGFNCTRCSDTGYVNGELCSCVKNKVNELYAFASEVNFPDYTLETVPKLDLLPQKDTLQTVYKDLEYYCEHFPNVQKKNILLAGASGAGKTAALIFLFNMMRKKHFNAVFMNAFTLNQLFLKYQSARPDQKAEILEDVLTCDFLVIDDIGSEPVFKNITAENLLSLYDARMVAGKGTAFSTNLSLVDDGSGAETIIDKYGERIFSRLCNKRNTRIILFKKVANIRNI